MLKSIKKFRITYRIIIFKIKGVGLHGVGIEHVIQMQFLAEKPTTVYEATIE
jgi:hypothetical protein